jgi:D-lactate dehydrogenase
MRITFFEMPPAEQGIIKQILSGHECIFVEGVLSEETATSAAGSQAVCVFVNCMVNRAVISALPELKFIATRSTGFDHIDLVAAKERGIAVATVPGYGSRTVAEFAFGLILTLSRKIFRARLRLLEGADFSIADLQGFDLFGKTLGVVGTGRIGKNVISIARGFGMRVLAYDPHPDVEFAKTADIAYVALPELLAQSDIVTLHAPSTKETHHLINADNIFTMKKGALLINTARGELIETDAMVRALAAGHLGGVGLDVLEDEHALREEAELLARAPEKLTDFKMLYENHLLMDQPNAILTPHIAFSTREAVGEILEITAKNILSYASGTPQNVVNP